MLYLIYTIHLIVCIFLILVVLLQQGQGADLAVFGGGSTQAAFGAVGATSLLHKLTVVSFVLFIVTTMTIAIMQGRGSEESVVSDVAVEQPAAAAGAGGGDEPPTAENGAATAGAGLEAGPAEGAASDAGDEAPAAEPATEGEDGGNP